MDESKIPNFSEELLKLNNGKSRHEQDDRDNVFLLLLITLLCIGGNWEGDSHETKE